MGDVCCSKWDVGHVEAGLPRACACRTICGVAKNLGGGVPFFVVPMIRIIGFGGVYIGSPHFGKLQYQDFTCRIRVRKEPQNNCHLPVRPGPAYQHYMTHIESIQPLKTPTCIEPLHVWNRFGFKDAGFCGLTVSTYMVLAVQAFRPMRFRKPWGSIRAEPPLIQEILAHSTCIQSRPPKTSTADKAASSGHLSFHFMCIFVFM